MRLLHLMVLVAVVALSFIISPALLKIIQKPSSGWSRREQLAYQTSLAMTFWTPILAMLVLIRNRSRVRRISRSYGTSAVVAAAAAIFLLFVQGLSSGLLGYFRGFKVFPMLPESPYCPGAKRLVFDAPESVAAAIVAVWLILAFTGMGRRSSDWFDRFCFFFGLIWVLWCLFGLDFTVQVPWLW